MLTLLDSRVPFGGLNLESFKRCYWWAPAEVLRALWMQTVSYSSEGEIRILLNGGRFNLPP